MQALRSPVLVISALAMCAAAATDVHAATGVISSGPANYCKPALPAFDGLIRTRPLAVQNEGTTDAFVTCSMGSVVEFGTGVDTVAYRIAVSNNNTDGNAIGIACTAVAGRQSNPAGQQFVTTTAFLDPNSETVIEWDNDNFSGVALPLLVSYSCKLAPGTAINDMYVLYDDGT